MTSRKLRIYTDGIFDLCHYGHGNVFKQIKDHFGDCVVIVGVMNDKDCHKYKGPTVMTNQERVKCVMFNKFVDEVISEAPWIITKQFMEEHKIDYCAYNDSGVYNGGIDGHIVPKQLNKFYQISYTQDISTTMLINRILQNHDLFENRNKNKI
jgi:choline-phosphate cytidylyltransferase